jgi:GNAT superfamily N-acetyltransferase
MEVKKLEKSHLGECSDLYVDIFNSEPWNDRWNEITAYKRLEDIYNTPGFFGLVILEKNEIKGAVLGNLEQWFEGYMYNLKEMFVNKEHKRTGIGSMLMRELENSIKLLRADSVVLFTSKGDLTEKFYIKNGFRSEDDMLMMFKQLK